ncbi:unnamed protein product, partial [Phaeothamnion confervicola]
QVGIGALVVNALGEMLVVREKHGPLRGSGLWKVPTGLLLAGEELPAAAAREVLEETGVMAEMESVLAFRHGHGFAFGKSDLFFVVKMRLKPDVSASEGTGDDAAAAAAAARRPALTPQASEIEAAQWMPPADFAAQAGFHELPLWQRVNDIMLSHAAADAAAANAAADAA